jgi:O-acetyl-ADP-ribose deacetylase (regulator of RNase III)
MITRYIFGDITETELRNIAHGVNCQDKMGSGVAKALFTKFPEVKEEYHKYNKRWKPEELLGKVCDVLLDNKDIYNCYTQFNYGYDGKRYVNYPAIVDCFRELRYLEESEQMEGPLAIPKIGCGLAGGDWNIVEQLINDTVGDKLEIWVYEFPNEKI